MNRYFFIFLVLVVYESPAQLLSDSLMNRDNYIIYATVYKKGVYKTFEEFKYNDPSIVEDFTFDKNQLWLTDSKTGKNSKIKKNEVWGFSDGARIFVRWRKYNEIVEMGRYCYFKEKGTRVVFGYSMFPLAIIPIPVPYTDELIINFNTGKPFLLSKKLLKEILAIDDPELLTEFMNEKQKKKKLFEYIVKYNDRNTDKIK
ncbi:hypothetical protein [Chryseotalea sanaruensis]|nr:hypothetical protein [Chryseotalea sanaruensis]